MIWFLAVLLVLYSCTPGDGMDHGIVGGRVSVPHSRPYMVYIRDLKSHSACDGFLVRKDFVMTAAHCKKSHLQVFLGVSDTTSLPAAIDVDLYPHPKFQFNPGNDIMLLKLKTPVTLNKTVNVVHLPKAGNRNRFQDCLVLGWGSMAYDHYFPSTVLRELNVTLKDNSDCFEPDVICNKGSNGPSQGDSGGPLICNDVAQGIVSFNMKGHDGYLTGYTRVFHHLSWIHETMKTH